MAYELHIAVVGGDSHVGLSLGTVVDGDTVEYGVGNVVARSGPLHDIGLASLDARGGGEC